MITLIAAMDQNRAIGKDGDMPWHIPQDLKVFQEETLGGALIMGRRTWESLPFRPLKNRYNCVVSRSQIEKADATCSNVEDAIKACQPHTRIYGIGGASIYSALLPYAHRLLLTHIKFQAEDPDTYFPEFNPEDWNIVSKFDLKSEIPCEVIEYVKK